MMYVEAKTYASAAEQIAAAAALRKKFYGRPEKPSQIVTHVPIAVRDEVNRPMRPVPDAHVREWYRWRREQIDASASPIRDYVRRRAAELGFSYAEIVGPRQLRILIKPRHLIIWEIKTFVKPEISFPELGRIFGGRDHTTILSAYRKICKQMGGDAA